MAELNLPPNAENALNRIQDTHLSPMEEALFKGWTKANKIEDPDAPGDMVDYRGLFVASNGKVIPGGELARQTMLQNDEHTLQRALQERMMQRIEEMTGKQEDQANQLHKEERQDITHTQKMDMENLKLKRAPHDLRMQEHKVKAKGMDIEGKKLGLTAQELGNEGKKIDLIASMMQPAPATVPAGGTKPKGNESKG
jgi:hypothetical protein